MYGFLKRPKNIKIDIPNNVFWKFREGYEEYLKSLFLKITDAQLEPLLVIGLLKTYKKHETKVVMRDDLKDLLRWLQESFSTYSLNDNFSDREKFLSQVYSEKDKRDLSLDVLFGNFDQKRIPFILSRIAQDIKAPGAFHFLTKTLKRERELKDSLREIMKKEVEGKILTALIHLNNAKGAYLILGKNIPDELRNEYFVNLPIVRIPGSVTIQNVPIIGQKGMEAYLVRSPNNHSNAQSYANELKKRIEGLKSGGSKNKAEAIIAGINMSDIGRFSMPEVPENDDYHNFRIASYFFLTGAFKELRIALKEPLSHLWEVNMSFEDILKKLPPTVLCKNAMTRELELLERIYPEIQDKLNVKNLYEWSHHKISIVQSELAKSAERLRNKRDWKVYFQRALKTEAEVQLLMEKLAKQIVNNSKKYYVANNG